MPVLATQYSARLERLELMEQGVNQTLSCPVTRANAVVAPTSGTITITRPDGTDLVAAAATTNVSSVATYTLGTSATTSEILSTGWVITWALTMPDGYVHHVRTLGVLCRRRLYAVVGERDLFRVCRPLDPTVPDRVATRTDYSDEIDETFTQIVNRLRAAGWRPELVIEPTALREVHLYECLAMIWQGLAARVGPAASDQAKDYERIAAGHWTRMCAEYDLDDSGKATRQKRAGLEPVWTCGRGHGVRTVRTAS